MASNSVNDNIWNCIRLFQCIRITVCRCKTDISIRSSAQGLFMLMTNGVGATVGTLAAQQVINHYVNSQPEGMPQIEGWHTSWLIFAGFALVVTILFYFIFNDKANLNSTDREKEIKEALETPGGMTND